MKIPLEQAKQKQLRNNGVITFDEIAYQEGDLFVAENVLNGTKRMISSFRPTSVQSLKGLHILIISNLGDHIADFPLLSLTLLPLGSTINRVPCYEFLHRSGS